MTEVELQYYAVLREQAGISRERRTTRAGTLGELYSELARIYGFSLGAERVRAAVDERYVPLTMPLVDGMTVIFIPPVAGG